MRRRSVLALTLAAAALLAPPGNAGSHAKAVKLGTYVWNRPGKLFGEFSGLEVSDDGMTFVSQSDNGHFLSGRFRRDPSGRIVGVQATPMRAELAPDGKPLRKSRTDSEGLAIAPDGTVYMSFEGIQRVLRYDRLGTRATELPRDPDFLKMRVNGSLEALAIAPDGALYTMPEVGPVGEPIQIYRYADGRWTRPFTIDRPDQFRPVGADFGPDGRLYLLERRFLGLFGFASRVVRITLGPRGTPVGSEVMFQSYPGEFDNLEGIAAWRDGQGRIRLTMISDDNRNFFQKTELVEFVVQPDSGHRPRRSARPRS